MPGRSRSICSTVVVVLLIACGCALPQRRLQAKLDSILQDHAAAGRELAARVIDLETGREMYARDADKPVIPASNMKLPVSAATLDLFGSDHAFKTYLAMDGDDLWLIGTGDPACGDPKLAKQAGGTPTTMLDKWADALKAAASTRIQGQPVLLRRRVRRPDDPPDVEQGLPRRLVRRPGDGAELQRQLRRRHGVADGGGQAGVVTTVMPPTTA